jgi:hypothetical protein
MSVERDKELYKREENAYSRFDTALLSVTSGAIALSVTVVIKEMIFINPCQLLYAWAFWGMSVLSQISSHLVSAKAMRDEIQSKERNRLIGWPTRMNYFSLITFVTGSSLFLMFIYSNFLKNTL